MIPEPLEVSLEHRGDWGLRLVRPDIVIAERGIVVEYDGVRGHAVHEDHGDAEQGRRQSAVLNRLGFDVIRVTVVPAAAHPTAHPPDGSTVAEAAVGRRTARLQVTDPLDEHAAAVAVARQVAAWTGPVPELDDYARAGVRRGHDRALALIADLWARPGIRRRKPRAGRGVRVQPIGVGTRFGRLVVTSPRRRLSSDPSHADAHRVAVRCDCGTEREVAATALRRTRTPQRYCGPQCPLLPRPPATALPPGQAPVVRAWAKARSLPVAAEGRLPLAVVQQYLAAHEPP